MDKKTYILPIITSAMLLTLIVPTLIYLIVPLAIIMIYAISAYCNKLAAGDESDNAQEADESVPKEHSLQHWVQLKHQ